MKEHMSTHLTRRGSTYYFRRKTPIDLIHIFGKEIVKSLGTKDRREAEILVRKRSVQYDMLFSEARKEAVGGDKNSESTSDSTQEDLKLSSYVNGLGVNDAHVYAARYLGFLRARREKAITEGRLEDFKQFMGAIGGDAEEYVRTGEHPFDNNPESLWKAAAKLQAIKALQDNVELPYQESGQGNVAHGSGKKQSASPLLLDLIDKWASERKPQENSVDKMQKIVTSFNEQVGIKGVAEITKLDVVSFKDRLLQGGSSQANVNQYLTMLKTLLNFAIQQALIEINPVVGVKIIISQSVKAKRQSFDLPALKLIFSSPVYTQSARPSGGRGEAAFWIPLLALFTGARLDELCQLRTQDVCMESYLDEEEQEVSLWVIRITDEGQEQKLKNSGSRRRVPIHKELIRLGFLRYVDSINSDRVFPRLTPAKA